MIKQENKKSNYMQVKKTAENILFCQFDTRLLYKDIKPDIASKYYNNIYKYKKIDGYFKGVEFWELPLWIAEASGIYQKEKKELHIISDIKKSIKYINNSKANYVLFSVLDINKKYIYNIIKTCKNKTFLIGGYSDLKEFKHLKNCKVFDTMRELSTFCGIKYKYKVDYNLFKGYKTIPRLTLSNGCLNKCKFCTIEKTIVEKTRKDILSQVKSFKNLDFKLVYINDKTYGQAKNYKLLTEAYTEIKKYNPQFKGFIVQTTASKIADNNFVNELKELGIFAVEIGLESFNDNILKDFKKPQTEKTIIKAVDNLKNTDIKIILNIIIGLIGENKKSYNKTLKYIKSNRKDIYILNIYNLAIYNNADISKDIKQKKDDNNELIKEKSFYSKKQNDNNLYFYDKIFKLSNRIITKKG